MSPMSNMPFVTCICPTYARYPARGWLLEEAVEGYRRQTYPADRRRLLIVNDCPEQTLVCNVPGVLAINMPQRFKTLGEKYNAAVSMAGPRVCGVADDLLIAPWEDDDLSLPNRLADLVEMLGDADYANPKSYYFLPARGPMKWERRAGYAHNASVFRRSAWEKVGGYPASCKQDAQLDGLFRDRRFGLKVVDGPVSPERTGYIYRFGVSDHHVSAFPNPEAAYLDYGRKPVVPGCFEVRPHWRQDYAALARSASGQPAPAVR